MEEAEYSVCLLRKGPSQLPKRNSVQVANFLFLFLDPLRNFEHEPRQFFARLWRSGHPVASQRSTLALHTSPRASLLHL